MQNQHEQANTDAMEVPRIAWHVIEMTLKSYECFVKDSIHILRLQKEGTVMSLTGMPSWEPNHTPFITIHSMDMSMRLLQWFKDMEFMSFQ